LKTSIYAEGFPSLTNFIKIHKINNVHFQKKKIFNDVIFASFKVAETATLQ